MNLPSQAEYVIIGGGVVGCATAYHLAKTGHKDVLLLEKSQLTSGSTWHAAGAVAQYRSNRNLMELAKYSVDVIPALEKETGLSTGWKQLGGMRVTTSKERRQEFERVITRARAFGLEMHLLSPKEALTHFPIMNIDNLDCGIFIPSDGNVSPSDLTTALAKGARLHGAQLQEGVTVTGFLIENGRVKGVKTDQGMVKCEKAAICAGIWSRQIGRLAGVEIPIQPSHHCYMITEKSPEVPRDLPFFRDPDLFHYVREEVGGLLIGQYDPDPIPFDRIEVPNSYVFHLEQENLEHFMPHFMPLVERIPLAGKLGVKNWIHGLESFTEDQNPVVGETTEVAGLFTACGFNAYGVSVGTGFGMALGEWMVNGEPPFDLWPVDIRRFAPYHGSNTQTKIRSVEGQGHHYTIHYPFEEPAAGRPLRRSAIYDRLKANGAFFNAKLGWERPSWFAGKDGEAVADLTFGRPKWTAHVAREHHACRTAAALFDQSSFAKFLITGRDSERVLQRLCAADMSKPPGRLTYTQMLNERGGIEADVVISRLSETDFYLVTGTAFGLHDSHHIRRNLKATDNCAVVDVTSGFGTLGLMGPKSRSILQTIAEGDLSNAGFPFGHVRNIFVAGAPVRALRVSFVGELGYELHVPSEYMATVYDALKQAGETHGLADAGYQAINSLRLEKGYRAWGADITPDTNPFEAGLGFAVSFRKQANFVGREALSQQRGKAPNRRIVTFTVNDPEAIILGGEAIYRNGSIVGQISSGGHGYTLGQEIGLGTITADRGVDDTYLASSTFELEISMKRYPAKATLQPLYDPKSERLNA
jgi:4-methylaminobutanoate oxidase (formaldehyde-forming)